MPYTLDDFFRDWVEHHSKGVLNKIPPEKRVEGISTEELERLLEQRRAAEASAKQKKGGKPGRGSPKRGSK